MEYGINLVHETEDGVRVPLSLYDQGRQVKGNYHGMDVGVKLTSQRAKAQPHDEVVVRSGTRLLYFVVVARLSDASKLSETQMEGLIGACKAHGLGGERSLGILQDRNTAIVFDLARSTAWVANNATRVESWLPGQRPRNNLSICI